MFTTCTATHRGPPVPHSSRTSEQFRGCAPQWPLKNLQAQAEATCSVFAFLLLKEMCETSKSGINPALRRDLLDFGGLLWNIQAKDKTKKCVGGCEKLWAILTNIHSMSCVILDNILMKYELKRHSRDNGRGHQHQGQMWIIPALNVLMYLWHCRIPGSKGEHWSL